MFWFSCSRNTKQLSMPHLSNKYGVFKVTTTQQARYTQVNTFNLKIIFALMT